MNYKKSSSALSKIIILITVIGLNLIGSLSIGQVFAYFSDVETSLGNTFSVGTLDFSLLSNSDFSPEITPTQSSNRTISVKNNGTLGFQYKIFVEKISEYKYFCQALQLTAKLDGTKKYSDSLLGFIFVPTTFSNKAAWNFVVDLSKGSGSELQGRTCAFYFVFDGWQKNTDHNTSGFFDTEKIRNTIQVGKQVPSIATTYFNKIENIFETKESKETKKIYNTGNIKEMTLELTEELAEKLTNKSVGGLIQKSVTELDNKSNKNIIEDMVKVKEIIDQADVNESVKKIIDENIIDESIESEKISEKAKDMIKNPSLESQIIDELIKDENLSGQVKIVLESSDP